MRTGQLVRDAGGRSGPVGAGRRMWSVLLALALVALGVLAPSAPAQAADHGPGWENSHGFLGARIVDGAQVYCIDLGLLEPESPTRPEGTVAQLVSHTGQVLDGSALAQMNYVLARWGATSDPNTAAAAQVVVWGLADAQTLADRGGDEYVLQRAPDDQRPAIRALIAAMRAEAGANAVADPSASVHVAMSGQRAGTVTVTSTPSSLTGTITLGRARFADGSSTASLGNGTVAIIGTPPEGVPSYQVTASGTWDAFGYGARVDLYTATGYQRMIRAATASPLTLSAQDTSAPVAMDFQPTIATQVAARYVQVGDQFLDRVEVGMSVNSWIVVDGQPVRLTAHGTLYGPFTSAPTPSDGPPPGAPVVGTEAISLTGPGAYTSPGSLRASRSGFYVWVWAIGKADQGANAQYLRGDAVDSFASVAETHVVPFQPVLTSRVEARLATPGQAVSDTVDVSSVGGDWLQVDGQYVPVTFEATVYQVPGTWPPNTCGPMPTRAGAATPTPADEDVVATVRLTATGPGPYTAPAVELPQPGFVTWVWRVVKADQPPAWRDYIAGDWTDSYGQPAETTSVRWPVTTNSLLREYNVVPGGRAFDEITLSGFPDDHGQFDGDDCWGADLDQVTHVVYGPFETDAVLTDDLDLADAPVLARLTTPARNGTYQLGWGDQDAIVADDPGYYVIVSAFAGDDRVQPYQTSPADIAERFYVPPPSPPGQTPLSVITQARATAQVGEPFDDLALVQGDSMPTGAVLVFRAYGPQSSGQPPICTDPYFQSDPVTLTVPGVYRSPTTVVTEAGDVHWVETVYDLGGQVLAQGVCGAPGETTVITTPDTFTVTTNAVEAVQLGQPASDVAVVAGTVPAGASLVFQAYRQTGSAPTCTPDELAFTSGPLDLDQPGEYTSEPVVFEQAGIYHWIESVRDQAGTLVHRGRCGAPGETTTVTVSPPTPTPTPPAPTPPAPPVPPSLAQTGGGDWMAPVGILAGLFVLAGAGVAWFGRRLAIYRERTGYVREEDRDLPAPDQPQE